MSEAAHQIPFRLIKQLAAYCALFESVPEAQVLDQDDVVRELTTLESSCLNTIELLAPQTAVPATYSSQELLPVFLSKVHTGLRNNVDLALEPDGLRSPIGISSFGELSARLLKDYCKGCTRSCGQPPCDGQDPSRDARTVSVQGDCISHLRSLFDWIEQVAIDYYSKYALDLKAHSQVSAQLATRFVNQRPATLGPNLPISAVTYRDKGSLNSQVALYFYVDQDLLVMNRSSLLGLPYILMHEMICHVFDGVAIPGTGTPEKTTMCSLKVGWTGRRLRS